MRIHLDPQRPWARRWSDHRAMWFGMTCHLAQADHGNTCHLSSLLAVASLLSSTLLSKIPTAHSILSSSGELSTWPLSPKDHSHFQNLLQRPQTCNSVLGAVSWASHPTASSLLFYHTVSSLFNKIIYHSWGDRLREPKQRGQVSQPQLEPGLSPGGSRALNEAICPVPHTSVPPQLQAFQSSHSAGKEKATTTDEIHTNLTLARFAATNVPWAWDDTLFLDGIVILR